MTSAAPSFSYAQAAKGQAPQSKTPPPKQGDNSASEESSKAPTPLHNSEILEAKQSLSNGHAMTATETVSPSEGSKTNATATPLDNGVRETGTQAAEGQPPQSPKPSSTRSSAAQKDDDVFSTPNESDTTWEKVSQASQTDEKSVAKAEGDGDDDKLSSWEHVPRPTPLKEAPPPTFNIWERRAQDQAKTKPATTQKTPLTKEAAQASPNTATPGKPDAKRKGLNSRANADEKGNPSGKDPKSASLPPPSDSISWPTPDLAKEEEKKKPEKPDAEKPSAKSHGKEKWEKYEYTPSAVFKTSLPPARRGGRGGRGGREGGRGGHAGGGDKTADGSAAQSPSSNDRAKGDMGPPPKPGVQANRNKRSSSAGPLGAREPRRGGDQQHHTLHERPSHSKQFDTASVASNVTTDTRSVAGSVADGYRQRSSERRVPGSDRERESRSQSTSHSRAAPDRRGEGAFGRESAGYHPRDRGEGRSERGRGGYRGRGGHNGFGGGHMAGQGFPVGHLNTQAAQNFGPTKSPMQDNRHSSQPSSATFGPRDHKHFRNNSRSQTIPHGSGFGRFPAGNGGFQAPNQLPQLQTDAANMYYAQNPPSIMSAVPYPTFVEHMQLSGMVQMQMEYYFSVDNLCKDMFLRKNMDTQGFVYLTVLQNFNRIKQLTSDIELIRTVCWRSQIIEFLTGGDGIDRVRKGQDWQQWVLALEERDPSAQHDGPTHLHQPQVPLFVQGYPDSGRSVPPMSPASAAPSSTFRHDLPMLNGPPTSEPLPAQTPLSAAVPDFTPSQTPMMAHGFSSGNHTPPTSVPPKSEDTFSDKQLDGLMIAVKKQGDGSAENAAQTAKASPNAAPNGSADPRADVHSRPAPADRPTGAIVNGGPAHEGRKSDAARRSPSPLKSSFAVKSESFPQPLFFTTKDQKKPSSEEVPGSMTFESYSAVHQKALAQRGQLGSSGSDMDALYEFWPQFLAQKFNSSMYVEFRRLALEDAARQGPSSFGFRRLIEFYDDSILNHTAVSDSIAKDYVDLAKFEMGSDERPALDKLRSAWRNGALPLRNRVKIDKLLDADMKNELDRFQRKGSLQKV